MARKAVQGFPEKSYYDNTRYLGIVATTDPLNEGLFKHMVNFDISDTGQSVTPRKGFLTTRLNNITLSNNTIIYKDNALGDYVLFDIPNNVAYIADISGYNVQNYYLPVKASITNKDWEQLFTSVLRTQLDYVRNFSNVLSELVAEFVRFIKPIPDTKIEHIYDENGISRALVKVRLDTGANGQTPFDFILQLSYRANAIGSFLADTLIIEGLPYMFEHPTLAPTERNIAVSKSIIPETFQRLYTKPINVDPNSVDPRPDGHISNLGTFVYIYDEANNYVNNFIYKNTNYKVKPYFTLNPAYIDLNNEVNTNDKWAYRFDIFNSSTEINDPTVDVTYSSPWMKYDGVDVEPTELFTNLRKTEISLENNDRVLNHYKDARYVIFVFSSTLLQSTSKTVKTNGVIYTPNEISYSDIDNSNNYTGESTFSTITNRQTTWVNKLNEIQDIKTLISVLSESTTSVSSLPKSLYYVYDLQSAPSSGIFKPFDESMVDNTVINTIKRFNIDKPANNKDASYNFLLTAQQLIDQIKDNAVFKTSNVVFKLVPYGTNNTHTFENNHYTYPSNSLFDTQTPIYYYRANNDIPTFTSYPINTVIQNVFNSRVYKYEAIDPITDSWVLKSTSTTTPLALQFFKSEYYYDSRRAAWYQWNNSDQLTPFSDFIGSFTAVTTPPDKPLTVVTNQWSFATLNFWSPTNTYTTYLNRYNSFLDTFFGFYKNDPVTNKYSIEFDLNELKGIATVPPTFFTSSTRFGTQIPRYSSTIPTVTADVNTIIHRSNGNFYKQITSPSGNTWQLEVEDVEGILTIVFEAAPLTPGGFIQNKQYYDSRTNQLYVWNNALSYNGSLTIVTSINAGILNTRGFFDKSLTGIFYMRPYQASEFLNIQGETKNYSELQTLKQVWNSTAFTQSFNVGYGFDALTVTYIQKTLTKEPIDIAESNQLSVFEDSRLLVWNKNVLFISEEGRFYWFKERNRIEFGEEIVKVLQYKQIILVFTTQHLYAVYRVETVTTQLNTATNQIEQNVTGAAWLKQIVLYNLLVSKKYADVIQIFNQMVLFYSEDGQLFMIRPSNTIDDQTRFNIQFFNKAANDILEHYDEYMNERLAAYGKDIRITKDQVQIKALVSINFIKILYYVPGVITYMLVYDVINNRYFAYDSLTFTNIFEKRFIESGDLFITEHNSNLFFTFPFTEPNIRDNHADMTFTNNFKKEGINCLIDTGNMNLNNHLNKRFRDLHVTFKNLNASNVLFNVETMIDEIIARPFYNEQLEVREIGGSTYLVTVPKFNDNDLIELVDVNQVSETATDVLKYSLTNNLFENNNMLMDFSQYTSSKLLTHRTSILGLGKVFRIKLQFISKGIYKLQHFGIIYKERRV